MRMSVYKSHAHTSANTFSSLHILYQFGEANKPNFFKRLFFFARLAINLCIYIWVCVCEWMWVRVGVAHTNSRRLSTSTQNLYIYSSIISYFAISSTFERFGVCVRVCVFVCLVAKIVAVCCCCCYLVRCVLLCRRSRYFLHAIVLGK